MSILSSAIEHDPENPPPVTDISQVYRNILVDKPVVTRIQIDWTGQTDMLQMQPEDMQEGVDDAPELSVYQPPQEQQHVGGVVLLNEDSMDVEQMQQQRC